MKECPNAVNHITCHHRVSNLGSNTKRLYSKLSVREKKLLQMQMEQQEKKQVVGSYLRKYFNTSTFSGGQQNQEETRDEVSLHCTTQQQPFHSKLSVQKYKHQSQVEKILQLELTRKRNSANPKAKSSPGRVNVQLLQKDIDESLYHSYSRKYFQHGFDVFIAKLRKECQANHRTKRVFCMDNRNLANELEERLSVLVAEKQYETRTLSDQSMPLEDDVTDSLIANITEFHRKKFSSNDIEEKEQNEEQLSMTHHSANTHEDTDDEDLPQYLSVANGSVAKQNETSSTGNSSAVFQFSEEEDEDDEDDTKYTTFLQRDKWFEDDIDDDFEMLEFDYSFDDDSSNPRERLMRML